LWVVCCGFGPKPHTPQPPIPNPQSPLLKKKVFNYQILLIKAKPIINN